MRLTVSLFRLSLCLVFGIILSFNQAYSQPAPQFVWEVRTLGGGVQSVPPFSQWTLITGSWDQTNPADTPTCSRSAKFTGGDSLGVITLYSKAEQQGVYSSQGVSDIFALYEVIGYTKTPGTIDFADSYSATVSNQNNDGLYSSSVTFVPYGAPSINADLAGAGSTSNSGTGGSAQKIDIGCGTQGTHTFSAYPGAFYYPFFSSGTIGAGTLYGSLDGTGVAEGTVTFTPQLGSQDPDATLDGPFVNGQLNLDPPIGSTVGFTNLSIDPDNGGILPLSGICSTEWRVTTESGVAIYTTPQLAFTALPGFYLVELKVTDNEGATASTSTSFSVGPPRNMRPGYDSPSCGGDGHFAVAVDPSSGNLMLVYFDPVQTRGYPLKNNTVINSQSSFPNYVSPVGNASFTYGMRVTQGVVPNDPATHWMVVDGDGRELDFGPTTSSPSPGPSVFSTLIYNPLTGFTLTNAGAPESIEKFGNYNYTFDVNGRLTEIKDPAGNEQILSYNASLNPTQVLDVNTNKTITFGYNTSGLIDTITENGGGAVTHLTYLGTLLNTITLKDNTGSTIRSAVIDYDDFNLPSKLTKDNDPDTALTFTNFKMANGIFGSNITDTQGGDTSFIYSEFPPIGVTYRTSQTNIYGGTTYYDFDSRGDLISVTMPPIIGATQNVKYNYTFNVHHDLTSVTDGATTYTLTYTPEGLVDFVSNNLSEFRNYDYIGADLTKISDNYGTVLEIGYTNTLLPHVPTTFKDGANNLWTRNLNQFGQTVGIVPPTGSPLGSTKYTYFENSASPFFGYLSSVTNGAGDRVRIGGYSPLGDILSVTTDWALGLSSSGLTGGSSGGGITGGVTIGGVTSTTVTGPAQGSVRDTSNTYSFVYDAAQRLTGVITPDLKTIDYGYTGKDLTSTTDEANTTTSYEYCPSCDKLTAVHAALGKNISWTLDGDKNVTVFTDPRLNNTIYDIGTGNELKKTRYPLNYDESYTYDNQGRLKTIAKTAIPAGTLSYDGAGRYSGIDYPGTNPSDSSYVYRADGLIESVTDDIGTATYAYTPNRLIESVTYNYSPHLLMQHQRVEYTYNPDGSRSTMTWKNGGAGGAVVASWSYTYDKAGRLSKVTNNFTDSVTYTYDRESKLTKEKRGNGTVTDYSYYQPRGWPTKITHRSGTTSFASYALEYDNATNTVGNITKVTELDGSVVNYTYDALYRLTGDVRTGTNPYTHSYDYDLSGNVTHLDGATFGAYNAANEMTAINIPGGSVTNQQGRVFQYYGSSESGGNFFYEDDYNLSAQNTGGINDNFKTDGHDRRVLRWVSPNNNHIFYIFDGDELIGEISRDGIPQVAYTWGNGLASLRNIQTSQTRYYHFGPQGETRQLTDSTGAVTDTYTYTAYGHPIATTGTTYNPHKYGGKYGYYNHGLSGQLLAGHRWYSPYLMRWLTHDPIGYEGGTNLYEYVGGNPVRYVDPDGLDAESTSNSLLEGISDVLVGIGEGVSGGLTTDIRQLMSLDEDILNDSSKAHNVGSALGSTIACVGGAVGGLEAIGIKTVLRRYPRAGGGGINLLSKKSGRRLIGLDYHKIGKPPNQRYRPHIDTPNVKHWPFNK